MLQAIGHGESGVSSLKTCNNMLVALGANIASTVGTPAETLVCALAALQNRGALIRATSPFYHTPAFPAGAGPEYVNAAAKICANWSAPQAMAVLHDIENEMGRERVQRWGQRTLDLDLLAFEDVVLPDADVHAHWRGLSLEAQQQAAPETLILPHPRVQDRAFVLVPLADIAPDWVHPVLGQSVTQMLAALPEQDKSQVRQIAQKPQ